MAYAVPSTYAAMPTMATMYGGQVIDAGTSTSTFVAAPHAAYSAAPAVTNTTMVETMGAPAAAGVAMVPQPPRSLTEGMPDEKQIAAQKAAYAQALDLQLKQATETLQKETAIEKEMLKFKAQKDIAMFELSVDERLAEQLANVDEQTTFQQLELRKAATDRKLQLENQASALTMDYSMKKAQEEMALKQYDFQQRYLQAAAAVAPGGVAAAPGTVATVPVGR